VNTQTSDEALLELIHRRLHEGASIEIGGMGSFEHDGNHQIVFKPSGDPLVFLGYALEDRTKVKKLFRQLQKAGLQPWMDCQKLLPGQNWPRAIQQTIEIADFFVACYSTNGTSKRGYFQSEVCAALEEATQFPPDDFFFVPLRLDECELPRRILNSTHYIDLFPDWSGGVKKLAAALKKQHSARNRKA